MTMHVPHPDTHTNGFDDDCPRCQQYPSKLYDIDSENLRRLWSGNIITQTDMDCYNALYRAAVISQNLESAFKDHGLVNSSDLFAVGGAR